MRSCLLALCASLTLVACQPTPVEEGGPFYVSDDVDPHLTKGEQELCTKKGGRFLKSGKSELMTCFVTPKDAGKKCTKATECSTGNCLARSGSCAPLEPLFGCHDLFDGVGQRVTQCVN